MRTLLFLLLLATLRAAEKPDIIFLLADDLGCADVGSNGATETKTPHLDKLAAAGAVTALLPRVVLGRGGGMFSRVRPRLMRSCRGSIRKRIQQTHA